MSDPLPEDILRRRVKAELRKRMRGLRNTVPAASCAARSKKIVDSLVALEPIAGANSIALFWPIVDRHEVDLRELDGLLRARGARVAYPAIDSETREMTFRFVDGPEKMEEQGFGFREPGSVAPIATELDAIVVPALAVDPEGHRIGYGAGYYDRTLPRFSKAIHVVVAFDFQLIAEVPKTDTDVAVQWVVTDARALHVGGVAALRG